MIYSAPVNMRLSQGKLNILETCARKFKLSYLDNLSSPISPEQQERMEWGRQFHLLMQQRELGLPVDVLLAGNPEMKQCYEALMDTVPDILNSNNLEERSLFREAEHSRILSLDGCEIVVVYDLLVEQEDRAQIFDWKTYPLAKDRSHLQNNWQTRLYPFVLAETSDYQPEQISMTYWFVQSVAGSNRKSDRQMTPQKLFFQYDRRQHEQTRQDLDRRVAELTEWLENYSSESSFPKVAEDSKVCQFCPFARRCDREEVGDRGLSASEMSWNLEDISATSMWEEEINDDF
jgi:hypothetical protein